MSAWLAIVGIGEDGLAGLGASARAEIDAAEILVGGARHLAMVPHDARERIEWPSPFSALPERLRALAGRRVCVLATGDPFCFGVGATLARHFAPGEMKVHPAPSCLALACARLGWHLPDVEVLSVHGRPLAAVRAAISPGARVLVIAHDGSTAGALAAMLVEAGYPASRVVALERLGGDAERVREARAAAFDLDDVDRMNVVALECVAADGARVRSRAPGLPDDAFAHDGQLTKRTLRASAVAALAPLPGQMLWDVGAGCGSIAIEWMRAAPRARAVAVERRADRVALIERNAEALGTPALRVVAGDAPGALAGLDPPDAVFLGGGLSVPGLLDACFDALRPGGRLVAHAVTVEGERALADAHAARGGDLARIEVAHAEPIGRFHAFHPARAVTEWTVTRR